MLEDRAPGLPGRVVLNLIAVTEGGQVTRARAFLARFRSHDPHTPYLVLKARGTLPFCHSEPGMEVREVDVGTRGMIRAVRRMLWESLAVPPLVHPTTHTVYLTFSHFLPWTFPGGAISVVGVSNLAPFSTAALDAEKSIVGRLRLRALQMSIMSSTRRATSVIALSAACRDILVQNGLPPEKIHVISNGVERMPGEEKDESVLRQLALQPGYLLSVSHFYRYKNLERLVQAYALLPARLRERFPLVLVGKPIDEDYYREVERCIEESGLHRQVRLIPGLDPEILRHLYAGAALFVFPSLIENSPNIMLEAMASGLPVLAGQIAPMPEFGGDAARYFDPFSPADMARMIATVTADDALRTRMSRDSLSRAARFTWDDFTARVVSAYRKALAGSGHG